MQLFINVVSDTAKSIDGHYINIGVSLASFRTVCFNIISIPFVPLFTSAVSDTEMSVDGNFPPATDDCYNGTSVLLLSLYNASLLYLILA
jgi:hypothetical protein